MARNKKARGRSAAAGDTVADVLAPASLEWALTHLSKYGDTDLFPRAFEIDAVKADWSTLKPVLQAIDLSQHGTSADRKLLMPKGKSAFRAVVQLDCIDALLYTGLVYEAASAIERNRVDRSLRIACSYRVSIDPDGRFFEGGSDGWDDFHAKSSEFADTAGLDWTLTADIADFYSQLSHHRIENALEDVGVSEERAKNVERFLGQLTAKQSRGLPVGPAASIILAEAGLMDVDQLLLAKGYRHTRYVDDFRIFTPGKRAAVQALHDLTSFLHSVHRLSLQPLKTRLRRTATFKARELLDPKEIEKHGKVKRLKDLIAELEKVTGYSIASDDAIAEDDKNAAIRDNLVDLFKQVLSSTPIRMGLARHLLRRATSLRTRVIFDLVLANLDELLPIFRDVAVYLRMTVNEENAASTGATLARFLQDGSYGALPFVRMWILWLLEKRTSLMPFESALRLADDTADSLGSRPAALLARAYGQKSWIRSQKDTWANNGPWDRRAIIWCGSILPPDERRHWLAMVEEQGDLLDAAVAKLAGSEGERVLKS
jgi:hypothetical protein